jgi:hypothetical protein
MQPKLFANGCAHLQSQHLLIRQPSTIVPLHSTGDGREAVVINSFAFSWNVRSDQRLSL